MALAPSNLAAHTAAVTLQNNLLESAYRHVPLFNAIERLESFLYDNPGRVPTINMAIATVGATLERVVATLLAENTALAAAQPPQAAAQLHLG